VRDRWTHAAAFLIALALHASLLVFATRQYYASASKPQMMNQAAQRLNTLNGQPVRFVYVKDMVQSKEPPMDPSRLSDSNRRGASPDPRKGDSPDPTSFGHSPLRQSGGEGDAPETRPSAMPSPASPKPVPGRQGTGRGEDPGRPAPPSEGQNRSSKPSSNREAKPGAGQGARALGKPADAEQGLPVGGPVGGENQTFASASPGSQGQSPKPERPGLGAALQRMTVGSLQGGYSNPNASRLNTGTLSFDTAGWDLGPYARRVQERVQSNWHVPEAQEVLRQKGWVAIRFNVQKDGSVTDLQVVRPSGIPSYDQSAIDALRSSNPLPPLPEEVTIPQIGGLFRFYYNLQGEE
jgi:periplasmic protein TonB